jgi:hypothetical protein
MHTAYVREATVSPLVAVPSLLAEYNGCKEGVHLSTFNVNVIYVRFSCTVCLEVIVEEQQVRK